ncbi:NAD(P)-dependent dehydrogenase, short-chain alcohol dehydrogenase family [Rhizobiales bacterium GAS191]|nr:NAD(P)-dependent dehydrogenase, short-chain alcohol dehydrogenase family [Rhizobiales bacterium GAS191]
MSIVRLPLSTGLLGRHVVIVGGSSGIGFALAEAVLRLKGRVTLVARDAAKLERAANDLAGLGQVGCASLDMTDQGSLEAFAAKLAPNDADHLVVTAAFAAHGAFADLAIEPVRRMFDSKFFGPYAVARALLPKLADGGSITFFSGILSRRPGLNCSGLGAVNAAVEGLTRALALALELGPRLRVNCCSPGMVRSDAYAGMADDKREQMYDATGESLPVRRVGYTYEIADAVLMMMTNTYLTGQILDVDGGHSVRQYATR